MWYHDRESTKEEGEWLLRWGECIIDIGIKITRGDMASGNEVDEKVYIHATIVECRSEESRWLCNDTSTRVNGSMDME